MPLTFRARSRAVQMLIVLVALVTGIALLPPLAAGAEADTGLTSADRLAMMQQVGGDTSPPTFTAQDRQEGGSENCLEDDTGDTQRLSDDTDSNEARADIVEHCVSNAPTISLGVRVAQPTDPREDDNWDGATFVGWFVDTDMDEQGDFFVDYSRDRDGQLAVTVHRIPEDTSENPEANEECSEGLRASFTAERDADYGFYAASGIDRSCFDDPDGFAVSARMFYDASGEGDESRTHYDNAPDDGGFTEAFARTRQRERHRLWGRNRMITATEISQEEFPEGADVLYLARQDLFADAVAGGVLTDGPILLVPRCSTPPQEVFDEVERVDPDTVFALGGEVAICDETHEEVAGDRNTDRLAGGTRIQTAIEISRREFANAADARFVFLARSDEFADAVTGGVLTDGPILLVNRCGTAHEDVRREIDRLDPERVVALGGVHAICQDTHDTAARARNKQRLAGVTRIETATEISRFEFPNGSVRVYLTRHDLYADAVVGGVLTDGPILMVPRCIAEPDQFPEAVRHEISRLAASQVWALGGEAAVCEQVLTEAANS